MKLTVLGGAGVRTPRLIPSLMRRAARLNLREVWLMDIDAAKLELMGSLCQAVARQQNAPFEIILTTHARDAIRGADHIITSIRPGFEQGRALDEQIDVEQAMPQDGNADAGGEREQRDTEQGRRLDHRSLERGPTHSDHRCKEPRQDDPFELLPFGLQRSAVSSHKRCNGEDEQADREPRGRIQEVERRTQLG